MCAHWWQTLVVVGWPAGWPAPAHIVYGLERDCKLGVLSVFVVVIVVVVVWAMVGKQLRCKGLCAWAFKRQQWPPHNLGSLRSGLAQ